MDPAATGHAGGSLISPGASRISLPLGGSDGIFGSMTAGPGPSGPSTGSSDAGAAKVDVHKREMFSDFRRFVSFGRKKETGST